MATISLTWRVIALLATLVVEAMGASLLFDSDQVFGWAPAGMTRVLGWSALWTVHFLIGCAAIFGTFFYLQFRPLILDLELAVRRLPVRIDMAAAHVVAFMICLGLTYAQAHGFGGAALALPWILSGTASLLLAGLTILPAEVWRETLRGTGWLPLYAGLGAAAASSVVQLSGRLWVPMSGWTFRAVAFVLRPILATGMVVDPANLRIGSARFRAVISPPCSGLEGASLMIVFLALWLLLFRKDVRFPQALLLVPIGVAALLGLNVLRIAALILIGHAGFRNVAAEGFHSEAGWILFNGVAFGIAVVARRVPWISRIPKQAVVARGNNATAAYLMPFLALLAAGILARAASGGVEWWYGLRLIGVAAMLWTYRREYEWTALFRSDRFAPLLGVFVLALWLACAKILPWEPAWQRIPAGLADAPRWQREIWIAVRLITASVFVPIAEELAFRGFLMRRFIREEFESVVPKDVSAIGVASSSFLFGILHGSRWLEATLAGAMYAWAYRKRGRLADAVVAHAVTNLTISCLVLFGGDWSFW